MKGVLFNVVEDVVTEALSAEAWDDVLDAAGVAGSYTSLGTYPDSDLIAIVQATAEHAGLSVDETLRLAGRLGFKHLAGRNPTLVEGFDDWRDLVSALDDIIHPEVRKVYPDAEVPGFAATPSNGSLHITYTSRRGLCSLAEGLIEGAGAWFGRQVDVEQTACVHDGAPACVLIAEDAGAIGSTAT